MKLHLNNQPIALAVTRKLKSVIEATSSNVEQINYKTGDKLPELSIACLPLLETSQGVVFSSNSIIRYLATLNNNSLYGNGDLQKQCLIDQYLDVTTCQFQPCARGISQQVNGQKIDFTQLIADINKFLEFLQKQINTKKFFVGDSITIADLSIASSVSVAFEFLIGQGPRKKYPNLVKWYVSIASVNKQVGPTQLPKDSHEAFRGGKKPAADKPAKQSKAKKEDKKKQTKPKAQQDDLFGDDDATPAPIKPIVIKKKQKPAAKSIVVFDVKVYEQQTDLKNLFKKIGQIKIDGLVWNSQPKFVDVAYGMQKLQVGCVVQDDKVSLQDLFQIIQGWQQVQSTDTVSFQKL